MKTNSKNFARKSLIASAVALALVACQNLEQEEKAKKDKANNEQAQVQQEVNRQREADLAMNKKPQVRQDVISKKPTLSVSEEKVVVTGSRIRTIESEAAVGMQQKMQQEVQQKAQRKERRAASLIAPMYAPPVVQNRENYKHFEDSGVFVTTENPVSTLSIDVDTASYTNVRRMLNQGYLPPHDAVRLEEFINYFNYDFESSDNQEQPFSVTTETLTAPWNKDAKLVQIGIKGYEPEQDAIPPSSLVFLVDVSGSMRSPNKLGLVKQSLKLLTKQMRPEDKVSLVVYAGASGVVLEPTSGKNKLKIEQAIDRLNAGGSTNGAAGIELAYQMAQQAFIKGGVNRVILATDGDFNVGTTNHHQLMELIESKRKTNIFFSSLGFGQGNYNDHLMEQLANKGNGNAAYIDSLQEAKKVLVDQRAGTLMTIAKDVKIQVEFNPRVVSEYRLLGYENRILNREDFNNDKVDAGEIGAGHTITALYEVVFNNSKGKSVDPLRYAKESSVKNLEESRPNDFTKRSSNYLNSEAAMVKLRYKLPEQDKSRLLSQPVMVRDFSEQGRDKNNIQFAASAAGFAQLLRGGRYLNDWSWSQAISSAKQAKGQDDKGYRAEMVKLMEMAQLLSNDGKKSADAEVLEERVGMVQSQ